MIPELRVLRLALGTLLLLTVATPGFAQSQGIVTTDRAVIWRSDSSVVAAVVDAGLVLELTGRSERWYEVVIPTSVGGRGDRGLIAIGQVRLAEGTAPPPERFLRGSTLPPRNPRQAVPQRRPSLPPEPTVSLRGFGQGGLLGFAARESFTAVTGRAYGYSFGAGAQVRFRAGFYLQASVEQFRQRGQRVFVFEDEAFRLGIENIVTIQPVVVAVGFRPPSSDPIRPYVGVGIGSYRLTEVSPFDDQGESVDEWHRGYHAHGGVEFRTRRWLTPAVEARYTTVPDALGRSGATALLTESNLGGWQVDAKVLIGR